MTKQKVLLLGATGETGCEILTGLIEDGNFDITCLVQPTSVHKPAVEDIKSRGINIVIGSLADPVSDLAATLTGYDTIINAISAATPNKLILALTDAVAKAAPKRYVPCSFATVCPPGGIMALRDDKQEIFERVWFHHIPYTIIDVGFWHQISVPRVPSGKFDNLMMTPNTEVFGTGDVKTMLSDKRDIGHWVSRIIKDERTLNHFVFACSDVLSQNEMIKIVEEKSGEKLQLTHVSNEEIEKKLKDEREVAAKDPTNFASMLGRAQYEYANNRFVRGDNTPEIGKYLGYLDARELYPDFKPIKFETLVDEFMEGKGKMPYADRKW